MVSGYGLVRHRWSSDGSGAPIRLEPGLGLSIALEDVRLHGGWLQAWGEPGHGSVFRLTLPWRVGGTVTASPLPLEPGEAAGPADGAASESVRA